MEKMTYEQLKKQAEELMRQAEEMRAQEKQVVIAEIRGKIAEYEIQAGELGFTVSAKNTNKRGSLQGGGKRSNVQPKYRDKATGLTWSGRGQTPKWLQARLAAGEKREDYLIA